MARRSRSAERARRSGATAGTVVVMPTVSMGLGDLVAERRDLDRRIDRAILDARADGWTWDQIAGDLGVTRQAAIKAGRRALERTGTV